MLEPYEAVLARIAAMPMHAVQLRPTGRAQGWVLAEAVPAAQAVPRCDVALVAGVAVASRLVADATPWLPVPLPAGARVAPGQALPAGCDAVLPPALLDADGAAIAQLAPGANVRRAASAAAPGASVVATGTRLGPLAIAALHAAGVVSVAVRPNTVPANGTVLPFPWLTPAEAEPARGIAIEQAEDSGLGDALRLPADLFGAIAAALALGVPLLRRLSGRAPMPDSTCVLDRRVTSPPGLASVVLLRAGAGTACPLPWGSLAALAEATHFAIVPSASEGWPGGTAIPAQSLDCG